MPRRTKDQAAETRERILEAALDVFSRKGYSRTTFVDIAEEIGLTKGAVYWHFKTKPDLLAAMISHEEKKHYSPIMDAPTGSIAELRELLFGHAKMVSKNKDFQKFEFFFNFQIEWSAELLAEVHEKLNELRGDPIKEFTQTLVHLQEIGELGKNIDVGKLSLTLVAMWVGALHLALVGKCSFKQFCELMEESFDMVMGKHSKQSKIYRYQKEIRK